MNPFNHSPKIYAVTDAKLLVGEKLFTSVETVLKAGCQWIQYREKSKDSDRCFAEATRLLALCGKYNARLIINDDIDLAQKINAHGVHLGQTDGDVRTARRLLGDEKIIGVTCHDSLDLAQKAVDDGATYIAFGRFFPSRTKPHAQSAPLELLSQAREKFPHILIAAIGGINTDNISEILKHRIDLIAVCDSLFAADDIATQANLFNHRIVNSARK